MKYVLKEGIVYQINIDETKTKILHVLKIRPLCIKDIAGLIGVSYRNVFDNVKKLEELGCVSIHKVRNNFSLVRYNRLNKVQLRVVKRTRGKK